MAVITWIGLGVFLALVMAGAWFWGKLSDPRRGGAVGCCHCGQCLAAGECVFRKKMLEQSAAKK